MPDDKKLLCEFFSKTFKKHIFNSEYFHHWVSIWLKETGRCISDIFNDMDRKSLAKFLSKIFEITFNENYFDYWLMKFTLRDVYDWKKIKTENEPVEQKVEDLKEEIYTCSFSGPQYDLAKILHENLCHQNHSKLVCDWFQDLGDWKTNSRQRYLKKAIELLKDEGW